MKIAATSKFRPGFHSAPTGKGSKGGSAGCWGKRFKKPSSSANDLFGGTQTKPTGRGGTENLQLIDRLEKYIPRCSSRATRGVEFCESVL